MAAVEGQVLEAVPWDEMLGAIGYPEEDRDRLVQAIGLDQFNDTETHGLVGYHLHNSCWELLTHHTIGEAARQSLVLVVRNLKELPADPWEYIDGMCPVEGKYSLCCSSTDLDSAQRSLLSNQIPPTSNAFSRDQASSN